MNCPNCNHYEKEQVIKCKSCGLTKEEYILNNLLQKQLGVEEPVCGHCGKDYDHEQWMIDETCSHCGEFLDNPPYLKPKKVGVEE